MFGNFGLFDKPNAPGGSQKHSKIVYGDDAFIFSALILTQSIESIGIADIDFDAPPLVIFAQYFFGGQVKIGSEECFKCSFSGFLRGGLMFFSQHHNYPDRYARQDTMPQPDEIPNQGFRFGWMLSPSLGLMY